VYVLLVHHYCTILQMALVNNPFLIFEFTRWQCGIESTSERSRDVVRNCA
jgi:hypothetical protein